jgi:hypothetical protein
MPILCRLTKSIYLKGICGIFLSLFNFFNRINHNRLFRRRTKGSRFRWAVAGGSLVKNIKEE